MNNISSGHFFFSQPFEHALFCPSHPSSVFLSACSLGLQINTYILYILNNPMACNPLLLSNCHEKLAHHRKHNCHRGIFLDKCLEFPIHPDQELICGHSPHRMSCLDCKPFWLCKVKSLDSRFPSRFSSQLVLSCWRKSLGWCVLWKGLSNPKVCCSIWNAYQIRQLRWLDLESPLNGWIWPGKKQPLFFTYHMDMDMHGRVLTWNELDWCT